MATLTRKNGSLLSFSAEELGQALAAMRLVGQARAYRASQEICFLNASQGLVIIDISWMVGLRLSETFEARPAPANPFGIAFWADDLLRDVNAALLASGFIGGIPLTNLAEAHLAYWEIGGEGSYLLSSNLVKFVGVFGQEPAILRTLAGGANISLTQTSDIITIAASGLLSDET